jgi:hypothetical protein
MNSHTPEALVIDLRDFEAGVVKLRPSWQTKSPRQHEMLASHDRVRTAIREALQQLAARQSQNAKPGAA